MPSTTKDFCVAAQQLEIAAARDVGIWVDRVTRNAGMRVVCDKKLIEFTRFTYIGSSSMTESWKAARASEWNAFHCNNPLWNDAIANGWTVLLNVSSVDGGRASFKVQCQ
jgi:hypothetical protein